MKKIIPSAAEAVPHAFHPPAVFCHCVRPLSGQLAGEANLELTVTMTVHDGFHLTKRAFFALHCLKNAFVEEPFLLLGTAMPFETR